MLDTDEISHLAVHHGLTLMAIEPSNFYAFRDNFSKAVYELGRQHQRESDSALCRDAAEKYADRARCKMQIEEVRAANNSNAAATYLESAIRNNTGGPKCQNPK
jgi:hypothetical protein